MGNMRLPVWGVWEIRIRTIKSKLFCVFQWDYYLSECIFWMSCSLVIVYERYFCIFCKGWLIAISLNRVASTDRLMIGIVCKWYVLCKVRFIAICYVMKYFNHYTQWWKNLVCPNACLIRRIPIYDIIVKTCTMLSHHIHAYSVSDSIGYMWTCSILGTRRIWISFSIHNFQRNMIIRPYFNLNGELAI